MKTFRSILTKSGHNGTGAVYGRPCGRYLAWLLMLAAGSSLLRAEQSFTLAWDPNPEPDVAAYVIYFGDASRSYTQATNVGNVTTASVGGLPDGSTVFLAITALNTDGLESDFSNEITNTLPIAFTNWLQSHFADDLARPELAATLWGDNADPDRDGRDNLMEYVLGLNPLRNEPTAGELAATVATNGAQRHLVLTFPRRKHVSQMQYLPEVSADQQVWVSNPGAVWETTVISRDSAFETVTFQDVTPIQPNLPRFIRLRVIKDEY